MRANPALADVNFLKERRFLNKSSCNIRVLGYIENEGRARPERDMPTISGRDGNTAAAPARKRGERTLSIIVPCYNEADNLPAVHARLCETAQVLRETRGLKVEVVRAASHAGGRARSYAIFVADLPAGRSSGGR